MPAVMSIRITKDTVKLPTSTRLNTHLRQALLDLSELIMDRAKYYAPYKSGKLQASIGRSVGKRRASVFQKSNQTPYGPMQERGTDPSSSFGFLPIRGMGKYGEGIMERRSFKRHPGVPATRFMQRAARDGRRETRRIFGNQIRIAMRG